MLDAWREQGADRLNPVRFHFMAALERRAANQHGEVRRILDEKLSRLLEDYAEDLKKADSQDAGRSTPPAQAREAVSSLIDHIDSYAKVRGVEESVAPEAASFPELAALDTFRKIWSRLRGESQLRQALDHLPANAGPLNSSALVHRSIMLMRELSPGYLQHFLSYADALSWMEQMNDTMAVAAKDAARPASAKKRARGSSRAP
jgi:Protein of unknown function (DUF2894)